MRLVKALYCGGCVDWFLVDKKNRCCAEDLLVKSNAVNQSTGEDSRSAKKHCLIPEED